MPGVDFQAIRSLIPMARVLDQLGIVPHESSGEQVRGPCPVHRSNSQKSRSTGETLQFVTQAVGAAAPDHAASNIEDTNLDELLVDIESNVAAHGCALCGETSGTGSRKRADGPNGNYLFELVAQPGGPRAGQLTSRARSP
jgi:hypothetical protein